MAARVAAERFTGRAFITQTWKYYFEDFPYSGKEFQIPKPPLQSVSSISYLDSSGNTQTWSSSNYTVDTDSNIGTVYPNYGVIYPTARDIEKAITVTFIAGYGNAEDVPTPIVEAIKLQIQILFEQPIGPDKDSLESARDSLLWPYRVDL